MRCFEMRNSHAILTVMLVMMAFAAIPVLSAVADGAVTEDGNATAGGFTDNDTGTLTYRLINDGTEDVTVTVKVTEYGQPGRVYDSKQVTVPKADAGTNGTATVDLHWRYGDSGTKYVDVLVYDSSDTLIAAASENAVAIEVSHSIWKNAATYIVIAVIIIAIIVVVVMMLRSTKKTKADTTMAERTFTKMHEEKSASKTAAPAKQKTANKETYSASGNKKRKSK